MFQRTIVTSLPVRGEKAARHFMAIAMVSNTLATVSVSFTTGVGTRTVELRGFL